MQNTVKIILIALCALLVILSLVLLGEFRKIIRDSGELTVEEVRKRSSSLLTILGVVIIALIIMSIYIVIRYRSH